MRWSNKFCPDWLNLAKDIAVTGIDASTFIGCRTRTSGDLGNGSLVGGGGGGGGKGDVWGNSEISCSLTRVASCMDAVSKGWVLLLKGCLGLV